MAALVVVGAFALTGCSGDAASSAGSLEGFRTVGREEVGLNGAENEGRAPLEYFLLAAEDVDAGGTEAELLAEYRTALSEAGWSPVEAGEGEQWWEVEGRREGAVLRAGMASAFHDRATTAAGRARSAFGRLDEGTDDALIVVLVEPDP